MYLTEDGDGADSVVLVGEEKEEEKEEENSNELHFYSFYF